MNDDEVAMTPNPTSVFRIVYDVLKEEGCVEGCKIMEKHFGTWWMVKEKNDEQRHE